MRSKRVVTAAALATLLFGACAAVAADPGSASEVKREGFLIGFSLGAGDLGPDPCDGCGLGVGGDFHIGAMASRALVVDREIRALNAYAWPMERWIANAAGGTSHRE